MHSGTGTAENGRALLALSALSTISESSSAVIRNFRTGSKVNFTRTPGKTMTRKQRGEAGKSVAWSLGAREAEAKEITSDADLLAQVRFESKEAGDSGS